MNSLSKTKGVEWVEDFHDHQQSESSTTPLFEKEDKMINRVQH